MLHFLLVRLQGVERLDEGNGGRARTGSDTGHDGQDENDAAECSHCQGRLLSSLMNELIQGSPAASLLLPLTTALEQELGFTPRVAQEVDEVAQDIRRELKEIRDAKGRRG